MFLIVFICARRRIRGRLQPRPTDLCLGVLLHHRTLWQAASWFHSFRAFHRPGGRHSFRVPFHRLILQRIPRCHGNLRMRAPKVNRPPLGSFFIKKNHEKHLKRLMVVHNPLSLESAVSLILFGGGWRAMTAEAAVEDHAPIPWGSILNTHPGGTQAPVHPSCLHCD